MDGSPAEPSRVIVPPTAMSMAAITVAATHRRRRAGRPSTSFAAFRTIAATTRVRPVAYAPSKARSQMVLRSRGTPRERRWATRIARAAKIGCR